MGDRCHCNLYLGGLLHADHIPLLAKVISDEASGNQAAIEDMLRKGESSFDFEEMNYASLPDDLEDALKALCLSYSWENDSGDEYGAGQVLYDARTEEVIEFNLVNGEIALTFNEIDNPETVAEARQWRDFYRDMKLIVAANNHERLSIEGNIGGFDGYGALREKIDLTVFS